MDLKISFFGAARNVTGSRTLIEVGGRRILVDCGIYQERKLRHRNWDAFPVTPGSIDAVLLTHAHLDHVGYFPRLVRDGFKGPIYGTEATVEIAAIVLLDSGYIQQEDARRKKKRHRREKRKGPHPVEPLYTQEDAKASLEGFRSVSYGETFHPCENVSARFLDAGHILGSSVLVVTVEEGGETRTLVFSGDVGRWGKPILNDPTLVEEADYVVVESTYGNRLHAAEGDVAGNLAKVVNDTYDRGGNIVVPSFAIERTHEVMYHLNALLLAGKIPPLTVFIDSPMAIRVTKVFSRHQELYDEEMTAFVEQGRSPFSFKSLKMTRTPAESRAINYIRGTVIVIAGSGMCTGGRIKHHLIHNLPRPESTVLFTGYQAAGTLGRVLANGASEVRIYGRNYPVKAQVERVEGFSGHGDRTELKRWMDGFVRPPRRIFVNHGEEEAALAFAEFLREKYKETVEVPEFGQEFILS